MEHVAKQYLISCLIKSYCSQRIWVQIKEVSNLVYIYKKQLSAVWEAIIQEGEFELYFHTVACLVLPHKYGLRSNMDQMIYKVIKGLSLEESQRNSPE